MALHFVRVHLEMLCACAMVGCHLAFLLSVCGHGFTVDHGTNCASGGFSTLHHNELRDFTAAALSEVRHDLAVEPVL